MEEKVIHKDQEIEQYFLDLPYTSKDRLHRYRAVDMPELDSRGRLRRAKQEDVRKGKIINNRCYRNYGEGSWGLIAIKLPNNDIITTDKKFAEKLGKKRGLLINTDDEWEDEKELERVEKLCKTAGVNCVKDYRVLKRI